MIQELSVFEHHPLSGRQEAGGRTQEAGGGRLEVLEVWKTGSLEHQLRASCFPLTSGAGKR